MREDLHILRLGYHDRANLLPLLYPLSAGWVGAESPWKLEVVHDTPASVLAGLLDGRFDAAFVGPVDAQTHGAKIAPLGGWGLATEGAAETAVLLAPRRLDMMDAETVSLDAAAQGSTAEQLLRTLLAPYYDIKLSLVGPGGIGFDEKGARLLSGDAAAQEAQKKPEIWVAEDLGLAWWVLTGLPMVWEMLCVSRALASNKPGAGDALQTAIRESQRRANEQRATILQEATSRTGLPAQRLKDLFGRQAYTIGPTQQKGLARFLDMAARIEK